MKLDPQTTGLGICLMLVVAMFIKACDTDEKIAAEGAALMQKHRCELEKRPGAVHAEIVCWEVSSDAR